MADLTINVVLPSLRIKQPSQKDAYLIVARDLMQGVEALSVMTHISPRSCSLIAAHTLECILKAFLWHKGKKKEIRQSKIQHNLVALWDMAYKEEDLGIPQVPPVWVTILSKGHWPNLYLRYQEGEEKTIVHGGQTPALLPMKNALKELLEIVEHTIRAK